MPNRPNLQLISVMIATRNQLLVDVISSRAQYTSIIFWNAWNLVSSTDSHLACGTAIGYVRIYEENLICLPKRSTTLSVDLASPRPRKPRSRGDSDQSEQLPK